MQWERTSFAVQPCKEPRAFTTDGFQDFIPFHVGLLRPSEATRTQPEFEERGVRMILGPVDSHSAETYKPCQPLRVRPPMTTSASVLEIPEMTGIVEPDAPRIVDERAIRVPWAKLS